MTRSLRSACGVGFVSVLMLAASAAYSQGPSDFTDEPDKTMASAHENFMKKEMSKAAEDIEKAAAYVKKEADQVAKDAKAGVTKAGNDLDKLGRDVKAGTVKSGDALKKTFAKVDHALATAWHKTA